MPKLLLPIIAALAAGGAATAGGVYLATRDSGVEETTRPPSALDTPEPSATAATDDVTPAPEAWATYRDAELGFSLARPDDWVLSEETVEYPPKGGNPPVQVRTLTFRTVDGLFALGIALAPNPGGLSLEDWVSTYPGWPGEPSDIVVDGQKALLFPIDQQGEHFPQIYFEYDRTVYTVQVNAYGLQGKSPAVTERDLQRIIDEFRVRR